MAVPRRATGSEAKLVTRIVKLGGSLFRDDVPVARIKRWFDTQPVALNIAITGGGVWADAIRELDRRARLPCEVAHELAIKSMSLLTWTIAQGDADWRHCSDFDELRAIRCELVESLASVTETNVVWFDVQQFLAVVEPRSPGRTLPIGWEVTSDSIAARLAVVLQAEELVVFKSGPPTRTPIADLAVLKYVDPFFPTAVADYRGTIRFAV